MNILEFCIMLREKGIFPLNIERDSKPCEKASNSEIIRLIQKGGIEINCEQPRDFKMEMPEVFSMVIFPKGRRRTTLFWAEVFNGASVRLWNPLFDTKFSQKKS